MHNVIDLFAGAGGFGLGFKLAGYNKQISLEIDDWAVETLVANSTEEELVLQDDIRVYQNLTEVHQYIAGKVDVIIGGPPCQGFSYSGPSVKDPNDPRNTLFIEFARWVAHFQPKIFVMENVTGLLHRKNANGDKVIEIIRRTFSDIGYSVNIWLLNAANYGVPQNRNRIFIVGNNKQLNLQEPPPQINYFLPEEKKKNKTLKKPISVGQAISDLPTLLPGQGEEIMYYTKTPKNEFQVLSRLSSPFVYNHVSMKHTRRLIERYSHIISNGMEDELPDDLKVRRRNGNGELSEVIYQQNYRHLKPNIVSYTIPASFYSNFIHPHQPRNITSREAARIQSFPDWYVFKGKRTQISSKLLLRQGRGSEDYLSQYNQIGNAVPPLLAKAIAEHLKNVLGK